MQRFLLIDVGNAGGKTDAVGSGTLSPMLLLTMGQEATT